MDVVEAPQAGAHEDEPQRVERARRRWRNPKHAGAKALGTLAVLAVVYTLYFASAILLPFVLAIVLYLLLSPAMRVMTRRACACPASSPRCCSSSCVVRPWSAAWAAAISVPATLVDRQGAAEHCRSWSGQARLPAPAVRIRPARLRASSSRDDGRRRSRPTSQGGGAIPGMSSLTSFGGSILGGRQDPARRRLHHPAAAVLLPVRRRHAAAPAGRGPAHLGGQEARGRRSPPRSRRTSPAISRPSPS